MYKRILVPLDGSEFSEEVIPCAVGMGAGRQTPVILLRIAPGGSDQAAVQAYVDRLAAQHGAESLCLVNDGDVTDTILEEAGRVPETLVAMTSHGRSGLVEAMLGSVAKQVVRRSSTPVLVWHPGGGEQLAPETIKTVVLPLDGRPLSEAMGAHAAKLARWLGAELLVVAVINPKDMASAASARTSTSGMSNMESSYVRGRASDLASQYGVQANWDTLHGEHPAEAIADYLGNRNDVLLTMASRGHRAVKTALLGSVTGTLLRKGGHPILILSAGA
ncbi:MAG: universal stress protein [Ottowia sp.]|nr:universal stress protein [Ottowia sp.]